MRRLAHHLLTPCSAVSLVVLAGCCGIGRGPTRYQVENWLAGLPADASGHEAYELPRAKGFSPQYVDRNRIVATRVIDMCGPAADWLDVSVQLDDAGRVVSTQVSPGSNLP